MIVRPNGKQAHERCTVTSFNLPGFLETKLMRDTLSRRVLI